MLYFALSLLIPYDTPVLIEKEMFNLIKVYWVAIYEWPTSMTNLPPFSLFARQILKFLIEQVRSKVWVKKNETTSSLPLS